MRNVLPIPLLSTQPTIFELRTHPEAEYLGVVQGSLEVARLLLLQERDGGEAVSRRFLFTQGIMTAVPDRAWYIGTATYGGILRHLFELPEDEC